MSIVALKDHVEDVKHQRKLVQEKLYRLGKAYMDGLYGEEQYRQEKRRFELQLESRGAKVAWVATFRDRGVRSLPESCANGYEKVTGLYDEGILRTGSSSPLSDGQPPDFRLMQQLALSQLEQVI